MHDVQQKTNNVLNRRVRMLLARINKADKPRRHKVCEADRPEHKLGIGKLRVIG